MPHITVLVGQRPHPVSGRMVRAPGDAVAVSLALQCVGAEHVRLLSAGALDLEVARAYLALGARTIDVLSVAPGEDAAFVLADAIASGSTDTQDLVFTGLRGEDGLASGALPYTLARHLRCQVMRDVVGLQTEGAAWRVTQALPKGARRQWRLLRPAVLAIHPSAAVTQRHAHAAVLSGEVRLIDAPTASALTQPAGPTWQRVPASRRLVPLDVPRAQSGHSRMLGAIGSDAAATPAQVLKTGTAQDKARAVFEYLQANALLPF
ncbi:hypothetical protein [uncultured Aquabacterium sp.]|uniref:hypothetical protein n=1 Tax=Aquabacterium sp. TaxID=1872578 RepID=UPI0025EA0F8E|nr:hypothetical protein [uncultured Aquabacterium sp.]